MHVYEPLEVNLLNLKSPWYRNLNSLPPILRGFNRMARALRMEGVIGAPSTVQLKLTLDEERALHMRSTTDPAGFSIDSLSLCAQIKWLPVQVCQQERYDETRREKRERENSHKALERMGCIFTYVNRVQCMRAGR